MRINERNYLRLALLALLCLLAATVWASDYLSRTPSLIGGESPELTRTVLPDGRILEVGIINGKTAAAVRTTVGVVTPLALTTLRQAATATVLPTGQALIWGGLNSANQTVGQAGWFDPLTNSISDGPPLSLTPRAGHSATVLTDGHLLVTGGWNSDDGFLDKAELWDYRSNSSELLKSDLAPRIGAAATLLADGRVLIQGGDDSTGHRHDDAIVFDSFTKEWQTLDETTANALLSDSMGNPVLGLTGSFPANGAVNVPYDVVVGLRFSVPLSVTSVSSSVTLLGPNGPAPLKAIPTEGGRLVFVTPDADLLPNTTYSLFVEGATAATGARVPMQTITFKTGDAASHLRSARIEPASTTTLSSAADSADPSKQTALADKPASTSTGPNDSLVRIVAGSSEAVASFNATCTNMQTVHGYRFCRQTGSIEDGVFTPGHSNTNARWRLNTPQPSLLTEKEVSLKTPLTATTSVFGTVRRIDDRPVANATVSLGTISARTDSDGQFLLDHVPSGHQTLLVDGSTANQGGVEYGQFFAAVSVEANKANAVPFNLYVPRITALDKISIPAATTKETVITHPVIPGLEIHIPAGTVFRDRNGHILTQIALVPMPADRSPVPLPANFPVYFSVQPATATIQGTTPDASKGVRVVYPNYLDSANDRQHAFWLYDATRQGWMVYTTGHLSADQTQALPDGLVGVNVPMPGGYTVGGPPPPVIAPPPGACGSGMCCAGGGGGFGGGGGGGGGDGGFGGGPESNGDPVDCYTGLFKEIRTDMAIRDILPISATRTYRSNQPMDFAFGRGMNHNYGIYLYTASASTAPPEIDLILPDGGKIPFLLVSGNLGAGGPGLWVSHAFPSQFYGAQLTNNETHSPCGVCVILHDGTTLVFPVTGSASTPSYLQKVIDRFGNQISLSWVAGLLSSVQSPSGRTLTYSYNANNYVSRITDQTGRYVSYTYTGDQLTEVDYPDATSEKYGYDASGRMQTIIDRRGVTVVTNQYDANSRVSKQTLADNSVYSWTYTGSGSNITATDVTDPLSNVRHTTYDQSGYPLTITKAYGTGSAQTTTFVRGQNELVTSRTDPLGRQTKMVYDANGNLLKKTYLSGTANAVSYSYTYTSDGYNQLQSVTDPLGHQTTYNYFNGCLTSMIDPLGHTTTMACNSAGQRVVTTDANGNSQIFGYSGFDLHTATNALGHTTTITTDSLGRTTAVQDPLLRVSSVVYDVNDRVSQSTDPLHQTTMYQYDGNGNLLSVQDPNSGLTKMGYDLRNRQSARTDALNHPAETWVYDGMNNLKTYTDRKGQQTAYLYDVLNRPSRVTYSDGSTVTPAYDSGNRLTSIVDSVSGTIVRTFDGLDRLTQEQTPQGTVTYSYDAAGRRATMTPGAQAQINYVFDPANRLSQITQGSQIVSFAYDNANRRSSLMLPNGIITTYGYDTANQLISIGYTTPLNLQLSSIIYTYDAAGQRVGESGGFGPMPLPTTTPSGNAFDLNNRQTQANGQTVSYDANGDPTINNASDQTYTFDARHRLTAVQQSGTAVASFTYDTFGRRIAKTINGTVTSFLYDGQNAVQETQGSSINEILTGLGIDERFLRLEAAGSRYFLTNAVGSTVALTDSSGTVQQTYAYEPYGEVASSGTSTNPYQYTGRENDGTGLYYYRARYYSTSLKRFISEDPMGLTEGLNAYTYTYGSPISLNDPLGYGWRNWTFWCMIVVCNVPPNNPPPPEPNLPTTTQQPQDPWKPNGPDLPDNPELPSTTNPAGQGPPPPAPPSEPVVPAPWWFRIPVPPLILCIGPNCGMYLPPNQPDDC